MAQIAPDVATPVRPARTAIASVAVALAAVAIVAIGVAGIHLGWLRPLVGFQLFGAGALLGGLAALALGSVGLIVTRGGRDRVGRRRAVVGFAIGAALVATVLTAASPGFGLPAINDVSTDLEDPPVFTAALREPANAGRDMRYPEEFVAIVQEAYPDLQPIRLSLPMDAAFDRCLEAAQALGWEITFSDPHAGVIEARQVSTIFGFVDDISIRVREIGMEAGSRIDVRSKSRDGRGDLGANARRIRAFSRELMSDPGA